MIWAVVGLMMIVEAYSLYRQFTMTQPQQPLQGFTMPTAAEGIAIPVVFGTREVTAPNTCWFGDTSITNYTNYYGKNYGYGYNVGLLFGICHGKVDALLDIQIAGKSYLPFAVTSDADTGAGVAPAAFFPTPNPNDDHVYAAGHFRVGAASSAVDAGVDDYLARAMSLSPGPAYHGVAHYFIEKGSIGPSPYLKPWTFTVKRLHTRNGGSTAQWYDEKVEIVPSTRQREDVWKYKVDPPGMGSDFSSPTYDDSAWASGPGGIGNADANTDIPIYYKWPDYSIPVVRTNLPTDGVSILGNNSLYESVALGTNLWLRTNMGPLPSYPLNFRCWHDDSAKLWFNGHEITLSPVVNPSYSTDHFSSIGTIAKEYINTSGPNVVAYKVTNGYDQSGHQIGSSTPPSFIYAGIQIGAEASIDTPAGVVDMNPAHIVHEVLTDTIWGMGYTDADIDDASFRAAADTLYAEGLGMSFTWTQQMTFEDFLTDIMRHISGTLYIDRSTGLFVLKLIRADYTIGDLLVLDESNVSKVENATRKQPGELVNSVTITYSSTLRGDQGAVTLEDQGGIAVQGGVVASKNNYPGITNPVNAAKLLLRDLRLSASPLLRCTVHASRAAALLNIGDPFVLDWPDQSINSVVMRVSEIDTGTITNGEVKVNCIEDLFYFPSQAISIPNDPIPRPPTRSPGLAVASDTYVTAQVIDPRDKGSVEFLFGETASATANSPFCDAAGFVGWTEGPDGTMTCNSAGAIEQGGQADGVQAWASYTDPGAGYTGPTRSWLEGKRVLVAKVRTAYPTYADQEKTGVYIIDDAGTYINGSGVFVATNARMHRDPDFDRSSDFVKDMAFKLNAGTTFGGHFVQLATDGAILGSTALAWSDVGTSFTFTSGYDLLRSDQISTQNTSADPSLVQTVTVASGTAGLPHSWETLIGTPGTRTIPAGPWVFTPTTVVVTGGDVGAINTLSFRALLDHGGSSTDLFTLQSAALGKDVVLVPPPMTYSAPQYSLALSDRLVVIAQLTTNSATPVTMTIYFNAGNAIAVRVPKDTSPDNALGSITKTASIHIGINEMTLDQGVTHTTVVGAAGNRTPAISFAAGQLTSVACFLTIPNDATPVDFVVRPIFQVPSTVSGSVMWSVFVSLQIDADVSLPGVDQPFLGVSGSKVANVSVLETGISIGSYATGKRLRIGLSRIVAGDTLASVVNLLGIQIDYQAKVAA